MARLESALAEAMRTPDHASLSMKLYTPFMLDLSCSTSMLEHEALHTSHALDTFHVKGVMVSRA
jgi:hypothetical protein